MRIGELISKLDDIRSKEGDLEIWVENEDVFEGYYSSRLRPLDEYDHIHTGTVYADKPYESCGKTITLGNECSSGFSNQTCEGKTLIFGSF